MNQGTTSEFYNPHGHTVHLIGPDGKTVKVRSRQRIVLPDYFNIYCSRGFLTLAKARTQQPKAEAVRQLHKQRQHIKTQAVVNIPIVAKRPPHNKPGARIRHRRRDPAPAAKRIVGKKLETNPTELLHTNLQRCTYPISNNIGVGILSYNRVESLQRLINSIVAHTDLRKTTVFVSDDGSTDQRLLEYLTTLEQNWHFTVLRGATRLGISGNTNRLLRCLSRFQYGLLLNDDAEVLHRGWDNFYFDAMQRSGMQHFMYREPRVYGARLGVEQTQHGVHIRYTVEKPHGAVLAFNQNVLRTIGYFNEEYGIYGMEHVDWSQRAWELGLQQAGFFDVVGSQEYFKIHAETTVTEDRKDFLQHARAIFDKRTAQYVHPTDRSDVPSISYVIPFRNLQRSAAITAVVHNVRAQRFPVIDIVVVEQDARQGIDIRGLLPATYHLVHPPHNPLFNKSKAFNLGVRHAIYPLVVLHDADTLLPGAYTKRVFEILKTYDACHLGSAVVYATQTASNQITAAGVVDDGAECERVVGYFEGGSIACRTSAYWRAGGFNEDYWGYGCFEGSAPVLMSDGTLKRIDAVAVGDMVITQQGNVKPVTKLFCREYAGIAYKMKVAKNGFEFIVTNEHPVLGIAASGITRRGITRRRGVRRGATVDWVEMSDLSNGGWISRRYAHDIVCDVESIDVLDELGEQHVLRDGLVFPTRMALGNTGVIDGSAIGLQPHLELNSDILDLIGYYAAEGCASPKNGLRFSVHAEEFVNGDVGAEVCRILSTLGLKYKINLRGSSNGRDIQTFCLPLVRLFKKWFPGTINNKRFPEWVMWLPAAKQMRILTALIRGDGHVGSNSIRLSMGNRNLVQQAMFMLERCGADPAYSQGHVRRNGKVYDVSVASLTISHTPIGILDILGIAQVKPKQYHELIVNDITLHRITKCEHLSYSGLVYNFEVADDHTYVIGYNNFHNCEDCDFYTRISQSTRWLEDRAFDFLHLWHTRTDGWNMHHANNRKTEHKLSAMGVSARIAMQHQQLRLAGYDAELTTALKET